MRSHLVAAAVGAAVLGLGSAGVASAQDPCANADSLREGGEEEAARAAYMGVLVADPSQSCALEGIAALDAKPAKSWDARFVGWVERWTKFLGALGGLVALPLALLFVILLAAAYWARASDRRLARWIRRRPYPTLELESFKNATSTATDAEALVSAVRVVLAAPPDEGRRPYTLLTISAVEGLGDTIAKLGEAVSSLKAAGAVVGAVQGLKPNARFVLNATIRTVDSRLGASALLEESGRSRSADTLVPAVEAAQSLPALAYALAAWTLHGVQSSTRGPAAFQTENAVSYALTTAGTRLEQRRQTEDARALYVQAIEVDSENAHARIALCGLDGRESAEQGLEASDQGLVGCKILEDQAE